ncbi:hypothetical protein ES702_01440 [subsurface metagenome]
MTYRVIKKYQNPKENQKEVNKFFIKIIQALTNDIIDDALKLCYQEYGLYPNVYTIKIMLELLNTKIQIDVSIKDDDLENINRGV